MVPGLGQIVSGYKAQHEGKKTETRKEREESARNRSESFHKTNRETAEVAAKKIKAVTGRVLFPGRFTFERPADKRGKPEWYPEWIAADAVFEGKIEFRYVGYRQTQDWRRSWFGVRPQGSNMSWVHLDQDAGCDDLAKLLIKWRIA